MMICVDHDVIYSITLHSGRRCAHYCLIDDDPSEKHDLAGKGCKSGSKL
jgi:hypothetical protein